MNYIVEIVRAVFERRGRAPGKAPVLQTTAPGGQERETELYQLPGFASGPTPGDRAAVIGTATGRVAIATHNYRIEVEVDPGEVKIFSTDADGSAVESLIHLKGDGTIELNGNTKAFVTHAELDTALQTFVTALNLHIHSDSLALPTTPPVTPMTLNIATAATTTVKTGG